MRPPRRPTTPATSSASSRVRSIGALARRSTIALAMRPAAGSSPYCRRIVGQRPGIGPIDHLGGAVAAARHAHVERAVRGEREAAARVVELHRGDAEIEDDAVQPAHPVRREQLGHVAKAALEHHQPGMVGGQLPGARDGGRIAIDGEHPRRAGLQDRAGVAAGAERGVEIVCRPGGRRAQPASRRASPARGRGRSDGRALGLRLRLSTPRTTPSIPDDLAIPTLAKQTSPHRRSHHVVAQPRPRFSRRAHLPEVAAIFIRIFAVCPHQ